MVFMAKTPTSTNDATMRGWRHETRLRSSSCSAQDPLTVLEQKKYYNVAAGSESRAAVARVWKDFG